MSAAKPVLAQYSVGELAQQHVAFEISNLFMAFCGFNAALLVLPGGFLRAGFAFMKKKISILDVTMKSPSKPQCKLPRTEAADIPHLARQAAWLMFGLAGLMLLLLLLIAFLAAQQGNPMSWGAIIGWILFLVWPAWMGVWQWWRYRQAIELEREHLFMPGKIIGFSHQEIGSLEAAPITDVYWIVFTVAGDEPVKQKVSLATWQRLKADDPIEVKVFPRNRRICRAELI